MILTGAIIITLCIVNALIRFVNPMNYFQLNAPYFNEDKGIYSKLETDRLIPQQWRLDQFRDDGVTEPNRYPVFVKPEWGQNASGIQRADNAQELKQIRENTQKGEIGLLIQEGAQEKYEFEVYVMAHHKRQDTFGVFSVVKVSNSADSDYPINSFYNPHTHYEDVTSQLTSAQQHQIWEHTKKIQAYRLARFGMRADSLEDIVAGRFHIIEINLFYPTPLHLFTAEKSFKEFILRSNEYGVKLVKLVRNIPSTQKRKSVFLGKRAAMKRVKGFQEELVKVDE